MPIVTSEQKRFEQAPEISFGGVQVADRVRETVPGALVRMANARRPLC